MHDLGIVLAGSLDSYKVDGRLGCGGTSVVWSAVDSKSGQKIALKELSGIPENSPALRSFRKEAAIAAQLSHPHILRVFGMHQDAHGHPCIAMELAEGGNLAQKASQSGGFLTWALLKPLFLQLCDALAHAHERGVIHRDLKPANLLLASDGSLRLADFGCAALTEISQIETSATVTIVSQGTLAYMSPQQLNGEKPAPSDDIYAVGATLHALLVGRPPFHTGYLAHQILTAKPPTVAAHLAQLGIQRAVPPAVDRIITACLEKQPPRRPASAHELGRLLALETQASTVRRRVLVSLLASAGAAAAGIPLLRSRSHPVTTSTSAPLRPSGPPPQEPPALWRPGQDGDIRTAVPLPNGGLLLGGSFSPIRKDGVDQVSRTALVRLLPDGRFDESFDPSLQGLCRCILVLADHRILCGGDFTDPENGSRFHLALIGNDGRLVPSLPECDRTVLCLHQDSQGRVLLGGVFRDVGGHSRGRIARLLPDFAVDPSFDPTADGNVHVIQLQPDGCMFVGGQFREIGGSGPRFLARLHPDGRRDPAIAFDLDTDVTSLALEADGSLLVGGGFSRCDGTDCGPLIRVLASGRRDDTFRPRPSLSGNVHSVRVQENGDILSAHGGRSRGYSVLAPDGSLRESHPSDLPITSFADFAVSGLFIGGPFSRLDGQTAKHLRFLAPNDAHSEIKLSTDGRILWLRPASAGILQQVVFEWSTDDGNTWFPCRETTKIPGGWQAVADPLPAGFLLRAHGSASGGIHNGSHGRVTATLRG